jgi:hypothetical protein
MQAVDVLHWNPQILAELAFLVLAKIEVETSPLRQQEGWFAQVLSEEYEAFQWAVAFLRSVKALNEPSRQRGKVLVAVMVEA